MQLCFVYEPAEEKPRNAKRRKTVHDEDLATSTAFIPLLRGQEGDDSVRQREELFRKTWPPIEARLMVSDPLLSMLHSELV